MNYILVGMPGSGKSSLGKEIAQKMNLVYLDLDKEIEELEGKKIKKIFEKKGEAYFRELERKALQSSIESDNQLISTGGGAPCFFDNMDLIKSNGISIFLDVPVEAIAERMMAKAKRLSKRPLIKSESLDDLIEELQLKLNQRKDFYNRADIVVKGAGLTYDDVIPLIEKHQVS